MNPLETIIAEIAAVTPKIAPNQLTDIADHLAGARPHLHHRRGPQRLHGPSLRHAAHAPRPDRLRDR